MKRRVYNVQRPVRPRHLDGYHKLVKGRIVVHVCVDGFSIIHVFFLTECKRAKVPFTGSASFFSPNPNRRSSLFS